MKTVIGIETNNREKYLKNTLKSLAGQADDILIYDNKKENIDYKANAKFIFLKDYNEPVYYFSCDDDIIYPPDYVQITKKYIEKYQSIITYHGDILIKKNSNNYPEFRRFHFKSEIKKAKVVHVAGTGLTAFRTDYFNPVDIYDSEYKNMVDQLFSLEAAKQHRQIVIPPHEKDIFISQPIPTNKTIWGKHGNTRPEQIYLANEILRLKNAR